MRLPWPFGRSTSDDGASSRSGRRRLRRAARRPRRRPARSRGADAPPADRRLARRCRRSSARRAPPPVVAPAAPFLADVPGHAPLPPIVHAARPRVQRRGARRAWSSRTRGPVPSLTSHAPLPGRPVQRHADGAGGRRAGRPPTEDDDDRRRRRAQPSTPGCRGVRRGVPPRPCRATEPPPVRTARGGRPVRDRHARGAAAHPGSRPTLAPLPATVSRSSSSSSDAARGARPAARRAADPGELASPRRRPARPRRPDGVGRRPAAARAGPAVHGAARGGAGGAVQRQAAGPDAPASAPRCPPPPSTAVPERLPLRPWQTARPDDAAAAGHGRRIPIARRTRPRRGGRSAGDAVRPSPPRRARSRCSRSRAGATTPAPASRAVGHARRRRRRGAVQAGPTAASGTPTVARTATTTLPTVGARPLRPAVAAPSSTPGSGPPTADAAPGSTDAGARVAGAGAMGIARHPPGRR